MGKTQQQLDGWPQDVRDMVNTNLQGLQCSKAHSFSGLTDWNNSGKLTDKSLKGGKLTGAHQLTVKHRESYRVMYIAELAGVIIVLHAFKKKTEGKSKKDMDLVESRLALARAELAKGI